MHRVHAPVSIGELFDKITILEIKEQRIQDSDKLVNIRNELSGLRALVTGPLAVTEQAAAIIDDLRQVNARIWEVEDQIRDHERRKDFGASFIALARAVYHTNDRRAELKKRLNLLTGSALIEEKSYAQY